MFTEWKLEVTNCVNQFFLNNKVFNEIRNPYESAAEETVYWKILFKCTQELLQKGILINSV